MNRLNILCLILGLALGAAVTRYYWPKIEHQTVVQEKVVTRADVRTVTRTVEVPGKRETIVEVIDNSTTTADKRVESTKMQKNQWILGVSSGALLSDFSINYTLSADRRIIGPIFAGIYGRTDGEAGISLRMEF